MWSKAYRSASRIFVDNGSSHRGQAAIRRLRKAYRKTVLVHTPAHASWLNQVEIYFSIIQRKVLTPNDFASLEEVKQRLLLYELSNREPRPFDWTFDRAALREFLGRLEAKRHANASGSGYLIGLWFCRASNPTSQPIVKWTTKAIGYDLQRDNVLSASGLGTD